MSLLLYFHIKCITDKTKQMTDQKVLITNYMIKGNGILWRIGELVYNPIDKRITNSLKA